MKIVLHAVQCRSVSERINKGLIVFVLAGLLSACVAPLLAGAGSRLLLALLQPMVGLNPNEHNLFEQPIIKDRMVAFLGPQYEPVMQLLKTADTLQREGPLFYVVSRYTPVPQLAEKAGFVWNSETNQMAVMLVTGGSPTVLAEKVLVNQANKTAAAALPQWPGELKTIMDADALKQKAMQSAVDTVNAAASNANLAQPDLVKTPNIADEAAGQLQAKQTAEEALEAELKAQEPSAVIVPPAQ